MAAIFNLNHHASYVHWHFFQMSVSNLLVIACMFAVFFAAIFIRFPSHGVGSEGQPAGAAGPELSEGPGS
jgi:hypothetical protein